MPKLSLFLSLFCVWQPTVQPSETLEFPQLIDADDIAYFFENNDLDGLHWALTNIFSNSERNTSITSQTNPLPEQLVSRGGGSRYTTEYKLRHDLEQAQYLTNNLPNQDEAVLFGSKIAPLYEVMLERIPSLGVLERTNGLYGFTPADYDLGIGTICNKALHITDFKELKDAQGRIVPLLNPKLNFRKIENTMLNEGVVVVDDLLSHEALARIRQIMLESTVFYQTKMPKVFGGYVGAYIDDGLHDRILLQLAFELYQKLPGIMKGQFLRYLWAYKYDSTLTGINTHADQAAVNVNIWLTPDEANMDPESGGLVVYTMKPPMDWDFEKFNTATDFVHDVLLKPSGYANKTIPYKQNRAVIFDSALFHHTDSYNFKPGYENRRINLTLLYGKMRMDSLATGGQEL